MPTVYTIPVRPTGTDTKNIEGIVDDFDAILDALNDYDGGNIHAKTVPAGALILGSGQIYLGGAGGAAGMVTPKGDISGIDPDGTFHIGPDKITAAMIGAGVIGASEIADGSVGTAELANKAVTAGKIDDDTITAAQIAANAIGAGNELDMVFVNQGPSSDVDLGVPANTYVDIVDVTNPPAGDWIFLAIVNWESAIGLASPKLLEAKFGTDAGVREKCSVPAAGLDGTFLMATKLTLDGSTHMKFSIRHPTAFVAASDVVALSSGTKLLGLRIS